MFASQYQYQLLDLHKTSMQKDGKDKIKDTISQNNRECTPQDK